ncbi:MAG: radical SAM protein [Armatimonadetes bacterium]|nr:radical SAM protein [Armatimonadota bacterium]MDE2206353.1 radical SAM protein [Armatimonadota bacterium]
MLDVNQRPLMAYWEVTRACELSCRHCRAEANPSRHPNELTMDEGIKLLDDMTGFGSPLPHLVFTGGDPLNRPDLWDLIEAARSRGFITAITPSGTPKLNAGIVKQFATAGIWMMALSIDGSCAARHDGIRMIDGSFARTVDAAGWARAAGLPLQVNTLICEQTADDLPSIYRLIQNLGAARWSLFFLIQVGRGKALAEVTPERSEQIMEWVLARADEGRMDIKTTEAPHYRRMALQHREDSGDEPVRSVRNGFGIRDGSGILFVSHTGDVYPAGFLPVNSGNVRDGNIVEIYRNSRTFRQLRDPALLKGKCGRCEYRRICGGSRARAYAHTGDMLQSDPLCPYQPQRIHASQPIMVG